MRSVRVEAVLLLLAGALALGSVIVAWSMGPDFSEAQQGAMHNCPQPGMWAISVWDGNDGTDAKQAFATCGADAVAAAYSIDPDAQSWSRWFAGRAEISNLNALNDSQGVVTLGGAGASALATSSPPGQTDSMVSCPQPGRWAISVWTGQNAVSVDQALASCGPGAVRAAYYLDPQTAGWLRWFAGRADISNLTTVNNLQGIITLGSGWVSVQMTANKGGTLALPGGASLSIPPGALSGDTIVTIAPDEGQTNALPPLDGAAKVGQAFHIDLGGATLVSEVMLELPYDPLALRADTPEEMVFLAYFDEVAGEWMPAGGTVDAERNVVLVGTEHLSWWDPFIWNWDAWIAVLTRILSLRLTQWVEAVALLTEQCIESGEYVTVDNSLGANIIQGCVDGDDPASPSLRVINLRSFEIEVFPSPGGPGYPSRTILGPGDSIRFAGNTKDPPPLTILATLSQEASTRFLVRMIIQMLPGAGLVAEGAIPGIAKPLSDLGGCTAFFERLGAADAWGAAEAAVRCLSDEAFIDAFVDAAVKYGEQHGIEMMTKLTSEGVRKVLIGVAAVDVIFSITDFLVNHLLYDRTEVTFRWVQVIPTPTPTTTPTPTPTPTPSGRIAFTRALDGNGEVYVMNADGTGQTNITNNPAWDGFPAWSPDGSKIAFHSNRNWDIWIMNADGSGQTNLTNNPAWDGFPAWSPDGSKIAFESDRDGNSEIYVMNADGSGQTNLTNNSADDFWSPAWSPDGSRIAFTSDRDGNWEIYVMNADGTEQSNITNNPADDWGPAWSPDGSKIAFTSFRDGNGEVYVMNADGTDQANLTNNPAGETWSPAWSPDGSRIAFTSDRDGNDEIYVMNADGTDQANLTNNPAEDMCPAWSP
jgi:hypothetical protein